MCTFDPSLTLPSICVTNDHGHVPSVVVITKSFRHSYNLSSDNQNKTTGATYGAGIAYPSGVPDVTPGL